MEKASVKLGKSFQWKRKEVDYVNKIAAILLDRWAANG